MPVWTTYSRPQRSNGNEFEKLLIMQLRRTFTIFSQLELLNGITNKITEQFIITKKKQNVPTTKSKF